MADLALTFRQPFAEQLAAFRLRLQNLVPTQIWTDMWHNAHDRGFMVAGAAKADLLADLGAAVDKSISQGTTLDQFRKDFRQIVTKHGWTGWTGEGTAKGEAWRTKVIYQTNMRTSYMAGRHAQLVAGKFKYWVYRHSGAEHPRLNHLALDGIALPPEHPFWLTHFPPNGWGCGCRVSGANTEAGIRRQGGDPDKPLPEGWDKRDIEGNLPGIGKGWDYAPGATVADTINALDDKLPKLPAAIGAAMFHGFPAKARSTLSGQFAAFVERSLSSRIEKNYMIVGALKPAWVVEAEKYGIAVESAEIAVTDKDILHTFRGTEHVTAPTTRRTEQRQPKVDPLDLDWYKSLPDHLLTPDAVLLDRREKEPVFLLVYSQPNGSAKLVIELNTPIKKAKRILNSVQSGRMVRLVDLRSDEQDLLVDIIEGSL